MRNLSGRFFGAALLSAMVALAMSTPASAWPEGWKNRVKATISATVAGPLSPQPVLLRLHSGNFDFKTAKPDGSDLRILAADDRTPVPFQIEKWNAKDEVGLVWIKPQSVSSASPSSVYIYSGNEKAPASGNSAAVFSQSLVTWHFADEGGPQDASGNKNNGSIGAGRDPNGLIGQALLLNGRSAVGLPQAFVAPQAGTISFWVRPDGLQSSTLVLAPDALQIGLKGGKPVVVVGTQQAQAAEPLPAGTWSRIAVTFDANKVLLYVNDKSVATLSGAIKFGTGQISLGQGFQGLIDEFAIDRSVATPADIAFATETQGVGSKSIRFDKPEEVKAGGHNYFGVLFKALTPDAWAVIAILAVMFVISSTVMITKAITINRISDANEDFKEFYDGSGVHLGRPFTLPDEMMRSASTLSQLLGAAQRELERRFEGTKGANRSLNASAIASVRAMLEAAQIRANQKLNRNMVLLTIAISGGPFLGLLGTVVGVMITFAAVAEAGDVNINAIAPGIAAALLATVAGLAVAIPALFGYNYLLTRIEEISTEDQLFVEELEKQIAENYLQSNGVAHSNALKG